MFGLIAIGLGSRGGVGWTVGCELLPRSCREDLGGCLKGACVCVCVCQTCIYEFSGILCGIVLRRCYFH